MKIGIQYYRPLIKIICRTAKHRTTSIPSEKTFLSCSLLIIHSYYVCLPSIPVSPSQTCQPFLTKPRIIITLGLRRLSFFLHVLHPFFRKEGSFRCTSELELKAAEGLSWTEPHKYHSADAVSTGPRPALHNGKTCTDKQTGNFGDRFL